MADNKQTVPMFWIIIVVIVAIILGIMRWGFGITQVGAVIQNLVLWCLVGLVIGLIFYAVYWLFFKPHKIDITYINKQKMVDSALLGKSPLMRDIYLSGDEGHSPVKLGIISGYCRIQIMDAPTFNTKPLDKNGKPVKEKPTKRREQDVITFKKSSFPLNLFEEHKVLRLNPEDHDDLVGDVKVSGFSLVKLSEYFFLNKDHLDLSKIDYNLLQEAKRGVLFLNLAEMKEITDMALGINPKHQQGMQKDSMIKIPQAPPSPPAQ